MNGHKKSKMIIALFSALLIMVNSLTPTVAFASDSVDNTINDERQFDVGLKNVFLDVIEVDDDELDQISVIKNDTIQQDYKLSGIKDDWSIYSSNHIYYQLDNTSKLLWDELEKICEAYLYGNSTAETINAINYAFSSKYDSYDFTLLFKYCHPQYFFISNKYSAMRNGNQYYPVFYIYDAFRNPEYRRQEANSFKNKVDSWIEQIKNAGPRLVDMEKKANEIIVENTLYDHSINEFSYDEQKGFSQSAYSMVVKGLSVCAGYAATMNLLMNAVGIKCMFISSDSHAWNAVCLYGNWYYVDTTWSDKDDEDNTVDYTYFNKSRKMYESFGVNKSSHYIDTMWRESYKSIFPSLDYNSTAPHSSSYKNPYYTNNGEEYFTVSTSDSGIKEQVKCLNNYCEKNGHEIYTIKQRIETCTTNGYTQKSFCSICSKVTQERTEVKAHHTEVPIDGATPTCTDEGYTDGVYCSVCKQTIVERKVIPATGHSFDDGKTTKEPTYKEAGIKTYTCKTCGYKKSEPIAKLLSIEEKAKIDNVDKKFLTEEDGNKYWYENGIKQGVKKDVYGNIDKSYRGKEIYDPATNAWYWLDNIDGGKIATSKDVYQESLAGNWGDIINEDGSRSGKWVRYDANGHMIKGWCQGAGADAKVIKSYSEAKSGQPVYYFDLIFGTMAKGYATIDGTEYYFNPYTGVLERTVTTSLTGFNGWKLVDGVEYWYEDGNRQGVSANKSYRGKEIYDPTTNAWYWLDNVDGGKKAVSKDVYQESVADNEGNIGKWVRYDADGHMIKGWNTDNNGTYYFDLVYGTMYKGWHIIDNIEYVFDNVTGALITVDDGDNDGFLKDMAMQSFDLQNQIRIENGIAPLVWNDTLYNQIKVRGPEIAESFSHTRPDGSRCFTAINMERLSAGENIAAGQGSAERVTQSWYNSPGHRSNMLNSGYTSAAVVCYYVPNDENYYNYYWVTMFVERR